MTYFWLRQLHIATVTVTIGFFALRLYWMLYHPQLVRKAAVRAFAVANDTLLLAAGISMALLSHQYPFVSSWLTAKLVALLLYILLGTMALSRGRSRATRSLYGILALLCVGYILSVALTRAPAPWNSLTL